MSSARASPTANRRSAGCECPPPRGAAVQAREVRAPRHGRDAAPERRVAGRDLGAPRGRGVERCPRLMDQVDVGKVALRPSQHTLSGRWSGAASGPWTVLASPAPGLTCAEPRALCCPPGLGTPGPARAQHRRLHRARPVQRPAPGCRAFAEGSGATLSLVPAAAPGLAEPGFSACAAAGADAAATRAPTPVWSQAPGILGWSRPALCEVAPATAEREPHLLATEPGRVAALPVHPAGHVATNMVRVQAQSAERNSGDALRKQAWAPRSLQRRRQPLRRR